MDVKREGDDGNSDQFDGNSGVSLVGSKRSTVISRMMASDNERSQDVIIGVEEPGFCRNTNSSIRRLAGQTTKTSLNIVQARRKSTRSQQDERTLKLYLVPDEATGNLPPMVEAASNNPDSRKALLKMLAPFVTSASIEDIDKLIHHSNKNHQTLLSIVTNFRSTHFVAHGILVEFEALVHDHKPYKIKKCLRDQLGSTVGGLATLKLYRAIEKKKQSTRCFEFSTTLIRVLTATFLMRAFFHFLDVSTDVFLILGYGKDWMETLTNNNQTTATYYQTAILHFLKEILPDTEDYEQTKPSDRCMQYYDTINGHFTPKLELSNLTKVPHECYSHVFTTGHRFMATIAIVLLPLVLYMFELLRFRVFSRWFDHQFQNTTFCIRIILKFIGNIFLLLNWPLISFLRHFWYAFGYENSLSKGTSNNITRGRRLYLTSSNISARAHLIEICTEASIQPLLQLYIVFLTFIQRGSEFTNLIEYLITDPSLKKRQVVSVLMSIITLAWGFTTQYRENKENSMSKLQIATYFLIVMTQIIVRLICFQIFAYSLGFGNLGHAFVWLVAHVILMSILHPIFSLESFSWPKAFNLRTCALVVHNCILNGLANIYVHNNLEIFQEVDNDQDTKPYDCLSQDDNVQDARIRAKINRSAKDINYTTWDIHQRTFWRQLIFDAIFLAENLAIITIDSDSFSYVGPTKYRTSAKVVLMAVYIGALLLKLAYYNWLHPWSALIGWPKEIRILGHAVMCSCKSQVQDTEDNRMPETPEATCWCCKCSVDAQSDLRIQFEKRRMQKSTDGPGS